nr:gas vesicle protein GvpD [Candidatus Freyarchaeota archaeon]
MIVTSNVPLEIVKALEARTFSLHIKGSAGTGKTTLALELMRMLSEKCSAIYLSTRVSRDMLYEQFPWSKTCIPPENILDIKSGGYPRTKARTRTRSSREALFEYVDKESFLKNLFFMASDAKGEHFSIVVDSLEALKSSLRIPEDDISVEQDILRIADKFDANVIFVSESSGESKLDYLVDGVVRLEKETLKERLLRKMYIEKIRGTKIENPMYLFTLKDGRFTYLEKGLFVKKVTVESPKVEGKRKKGKISTLIPELDKILNGGYDKGSFNIFDVNKNVGRLHAYVLSSMFFKFIRQGFPMFYLPSKGITSSDLVGYVPSSFLDKDFLNSLKRYFYVFKLKEFDAQARTVSYNQFFFEGEDYVKDLNIFKEIVVKVLGEVQTDSFVIVMASDMIEYIYGSRDILKIIQTWMNEVKRLNGVMIVVQFEQESFRLPNYMAASHFRLENIGGNIVFYGEIPRTKIYVITLEVSDKYVQIRFIPVE